MFCGFLELLFLIVIDVRPLALGETIHEERLRTAPEKNDRPVAFRSSLSRSGDPLFDDFATKISVASGKAALAKDAKVTSKKGQGETLIVVGARVVEPEAKAK